MKRLILILILSLIGAAAAESSSSSSSSSAINSNGGSSSSRSTAAMDNRSDWYRIWHVGRYESHQRIEHQIKKRSAPADDTVPAAVGRTCSNFRYSHRHEDDSHHAEPSTCPFRWQINESPDRRPRILNEIVCRRCSSCAGRSDYHCVQLKSTLEVYWTNDNTWETYDLAAGCACLPRIRAAHSPYNV